MKKTITLKYSDFPDIQELPSNPILDIINSGKRVNAANLARYLKISQKSAEEKLSRLENKGLIQSKVTTIVDSLGRPNRGRMYFKK